MRWEVSPPSFMSLWPGYGNSYPGLFFCALRMRAKNAQNAQKCAEVRNAPQRVRTCSSGLRISA